MTWPVGVPWIAKPRSRAAVSSWVNRSCARRLYLSRSAVRSWSKSSLAKGLGQLREDEIDQLLHPRLQFAALPRPQLDRQRCLGRAKIVDVHPVAGGRHGRRPLLQQAQNRIALGPRPQAADKNVIAGSVDPDPQPNRVERASLPEQMIALTIAREPQ